MFLPTASRSLNHLIVRLRPKDCEATTKLHRRIVDQFRVLK
jgi:hypothetical protein